MRYTQGWLNQAGGTYKFTAMGRPSPGTTTLTDGVAKLSVRLEVVQVDVLALVGLVGVVCYGLNATMLALNLVLLSALLTETHPLLVIVVASGALLSPCSLYLSVSSYIR